MCIQSNPGPQPDQSRKPKFVGVTAAARRFAVGKNQILAHIKAGTLVAIDMRKPGAQRPLFRIAAEELARFEKSLPATRPARATVRRRRKHIPNHLDGN